MSRTSNGVRKTLAAAGVSALALMAASAPAQAASLSQTYSCLYPLISSQPLSVNIDASIPASWPVNTPTPPFDISAVSTTNDTTWDGLNLVQAKTIEGVAQASSTVNAPGFSLPVVVPITVEKTNIPATRGPITINATGQTPALSFPQTGTGDITVDSIKLNLRAKKADGTSVVFPPTPGVPDSDGLAETFDVPCTLSPAGQNKKLTDLTITGGGGGGDTVAPSKPGAPSIGSPSDVTPTTAKISWGASTDNVGVTGYEISYDDEVITVGNVTTTTLTGLLPDSQYFVSVKAVDAAGNKSAASDELELLTPVETAPDTVAPSKPTGLAGTATTSSVALSWNASTDNVGVAGYDVFQNGAKVQSVTGTSATVSGLSAGTAYKFKVQARDAKPNLSAFSDEITVTTQSSGGGGTVKYGYTLKGTSALKTLTRGAVPITGGIDADLELATGNYTADLVLNKTRARLQVLGILPVTADIAFVQTDKTRGKLEGGVLTATARFKVRLPQLYLFGAIPITDPGKCQTKTASVATMKSTAAFFNPLEGGQLKGTYGLSDLTGCGPLEAFISPLTKGSGNTIDINLTPKS